MVFLVKWVKISLFCLKWPEWYFCSFINREWFVNILCLWHIFACFAFPSIMILSLYSVLSLFWTLYHRNFLLFKVMHFSHVFLKMNFPEMSRNVLHDHCRIVCTDTLSPCSECYLSINKAWLGIVSLALITSFACIECGIKWMPGAS